MLHIDSFCQQVATSDSLYEWIIDSFIQSIHSKHGFIYEQIWLFLYMIHGIIYSIDLFNTLIHSRTKASPNHSFNRFARWFIHEKPPLLCVAQTYLRVYRQVGYSVANRWRSFSCLHRLASGKLREYGLNEHHDISAGVEVILEESDVTSGREMSFKQVGLSFISYTEACFEGGMTKIDDCEALFFLLISCKILQTAMELACSLLYCVG